MTAEPERRTLRFENLDQVSAEVQRLNSGPTRTTGNYSYAQILEHLARTLDVVSGHTPAPKFPLPLRMMLRVVRSSILSRPMKPGIRLAPNAQSVFWPDGPVEDSAAQTHFAEAMKRYRAVESFRKHSLFGTMTRVQHDQLQLRHCEMHLSFVHPDAQQTDSPRPADDA